VPIPLAQLDSATLHESLLRSVEAGNVAAAKYPIAVYQLNDVWTINWTKSAGWRLAGSVFGLILGDEQLRSIRRPYLSEEPALMVVALCAAGVVLCLAALLILRRWHLRMSARTAPPGRAQAPSESPVAAQN
jgi:hypothetical protein